MERQQDERHQEEKKSGIVLEEKEIFRYSIYKYDEENIEIHMNGNIEKELLISAMADFLEEELGMFCISEEVITEFLNTVEKVLDKIEQTQIISNKECSENIEEEQ